MQVDELQDQLRAAQGGIDGLEGQARQQQQRMEQLLSSLAATADISMPVLDAIGASEERPAAFPAAVQQLCTQVPPLLQCTYRHPYKACLKQGQDLRPKWHGRYTGTRCAYTRGL